MKGQFRFRNVLLLSGILSSLCYAAANVAGPLHWPGYSSLHQAVSELSAIGAPSRPAVLPWFIAYSLLALAFGFGVWQHGTDNRALRRAGVALVILGFIDVAGPLFPMNMRGSAPALTDALHIALTAVTVAVILAAMALAAPAFGKGFRRYSILSILVIVIFGTVAGLQGPHIATGEPTRWMGVYERINIGGYLLWQAVLAFLLMRKPAVRNRHPHR